MSVDRDLGFIKWNDKYGKPENMNSTEFKVALQQEKATYNKVLENVPDSLIKAWSQTYERLPKIYDNYYEFYWLIACWGSFDFYKKSRAEYSCSHCCIEIMADPCHIFSQPLVFFA
jgi:hypothetical protein